MATSLVQQPALIVHAATAIGRHAWRLGVLPRPAAFDRGRTATRPLCQPVNPRPGRAGVAEAIYAGRFTLAGATVETGAKSIFDMPAPSRAFADARDGFAWLAHHAAARDDLATCNAQALVLDFLARKRRGPFDTAHAPTVTARRLTAWLTHGDLLLSGAQPAFRNRFMAALTADWRRLRLGVEAAPDGLPRLGARTALALAALALPMPAAARESAWRALSAELDRQILPDGGHVSRDPSVLPGLFLDLAALRETAHGQNCPVPHSLNRAVDSIAPALAFFSHADGTLARFNGAASAASADFRSLHAVVGAVATPFSHAPHSGYRRLAEGESVVIADTGRPPALGFSREAHAGTLAFELSSGGDRIVVNCGRIDGEDAALRRLGRTTAAHSTVAIADRSSSRFALSPRLDRFLGQPLVSGPRNVTSRGLDGDGQGFDASHDGYLSRYGVRHRRLMRLMGKGTVLEGIDRLEGRPARGGEPVTAAARFHLDPAVSVAPLAHGARLTLRDQTWMMTADAPVRVEDSLVFDGDRGARRTQQIVVDFDVAPNAAIRWRFRRER